MKISKCKSLKGPRMKINYLSLNIPYIGILEYINVLFLAHFIEELFMTDIDFFQLKFIQLHMNLAKLHMSFFRIFSEIFEDANRLVISTKVKLSEKFELDDKLHMNLAQ